MELVRISGKRTNSSGLLRTSGLARLWDQCLFLLRVLEKRSAVRTMIDRSTACQHDLLLDCVQRVRYIEIANSNRLLRRQTAPSHRQTPSELLFEQSRLVHRLSKSRACRVRCPTSKHAILSAVNESVNEPYVDEEVNEALRQSIINSTLRLDRTRSAHREPRASRLPPRGGLRLEDA